MKSKRILSVIGEIDDKYITEAVPIDKKVHKISWIRWGIVAACFCIVVAAVGPVYQRIAHLKEVKIPTNDPGYNKQELNNLIDDIDDTVVLSSRIIEYHNSLYEILDKKESYIKFGLVEEVTKEVAGEHVAYIKGRKGNEEGEFVESKKATDMELLTYIPNPCDGIYVVRMGTEYSIALYCNPSADDGNSHIEMKEIYHIFGINSSEDIAAVYETTWDVKKTLGSKVTERDKINEFYDATIAMKAYSNDEWQQIIFGGMTEEQQQQVRDDNEGNTRYICIETTSGFRFTIETSSYSGWIYTALAYYQMTDDVNRWMKENLK